jgi:hypothetical protein
MALKVIEVSRDVKELKNLTTINKKITKNIVGIDSTYSNRNILSEIISIRSLLDWRLPPKESKVSGLDEVLKDLKDESE